MIDSYISVKQEKLEKQGLEVIKQQGKNYIDLYSGGRLDGLSGLEPRSPDIYWQGYQLGQREYWCKLRGLEIPEIETFESDCTGSKPSA
ncbi:hypothetical protein STA3757_49760 (plasmid) [Stanieria sp. NIES-3757]|uniref:Uncharacterized protein n=1 Tax=Stanieria cyanosphaera (strain ATCC 29371 / PCC 7437) TaxID=111780 RepID=K9Y117_STAC7|nr:hypothetical protein [Stanieria cyanosphaera]AFZ38066.1 hypothetical protein Sta7437_4608 [Stanieria cyanosphaera PCC 7437]BAU67554.1 hypothetical protein STA3757_49760 [Stanieria sp. NIES-3757]